MYKTIAACCLLLALTSCATLQHAAEYNLKTSFYKEESREHQKTTVYLSVQQDSLRAYPLRGRGKYAVADSLHYTAFTLPVTSTKKIPTQIFIHEGIDMDLISILFKFRPAVNVIPPQLNTNFNAAGYLGYRWDRYVVDYKINPLRQYERKSHHFAYGTGAFLGIGATAVNEYVTFPPIDRQYEGLVIADGVTGIVSIGNISFGAALGMDRLMGAQHSSWAYNSKLWVGLTVGLNLN
jgi:hypothetical protein